MVRIFIALLLVGSALEAGGQDLAGTPTRRETEYKKAFILNESSSVDEFKSTLLRLIQSGIRHSKFNLPKVLGDQYHAPVRFTDFVFRDIYLDSPDRSLLEFSSSYRLRYRWNETLRFIWHRLNLPFTYGQPNRCEIQFKGGYRFHLDRGMVTVDETRFEFRKESNPFSDGEAVPSRPWEIKPFLDYATSGRFRNYEIMPFNALKRKFAEHHQDLSRIVPVLDVVTRRDRLHLRVANPFGADPNPDQVMIITLDQSRRYSQTLSDSRELGGMRLFEVEVEPERNITTNLDELLEYENMRVPFGVEVINEAISFGKAVREALFLDVEILRGMVEEAADQSLSGQILPLDYKYSRFMKLGKSEAFP